MLRCKAEDRLGGRLEYAIIAETLLGESWN